MKFVKGDKVEFILNGKWETGIIKAYRIDSTNYEMFDYIIAHNGKEYKRPSNCIRYCYMSENELNIDWNTLIDNVHRVIDEIHKTAIKKHIDELKASTII